MDRLDEDVEDSPEANHKELALCRFVVQYVKRIRKVCNEEGDRLARLGHGQELQDIRSDVHCTRKLGTLELPRRQGNLGPLGVDHDARLELPGSHLFDHPEPVQDWLGTQILDHVLHGGTPQDVFRLNRLPSSKAQRQRFRLRSSERDRQNRDRRNEIVRIGIVSRLGKACKLLRHQLVFLDTTVVGEVGLRLQVERVDQDGILFHRISREDATVWDLLEYP